MNKKTLIISLVVCCVAVLFVAMGVVTCFVIKGLNDLRDLPSTTALNENTTVQTVNAVPKTTENQQPMENQQPTEVSQPTELTDLLSKSDYDFTDLENTNQLIVVTGENGEYYLECYDCNNGVWESNGIKSKAFVGKNGTVSPDIKTEGDYYSPQGLYGLDFAFGTGKNPGTEMEYRDVYEGIYWVDDPESDFYNQWVDGKTHKIQWNSAEKMWSYDEYIYGAVINYNTDPIVKNKGSAIFLHVGYKYTAGCVASDEATIVSILKWLKPDENPKILIY